MVLVWCGRLTADRIECVRISCDEHQTRSFPGEFKSDGASDAPTGARNKRETVFDSQIHRAVIKKPRGEVKQPDGSTQLL